MLSVSLAIGLDRLQSVTGSTAGVEAMPVTIKEDIQLVGMRQRPAEARKTTGLSYYHIP
jgi:hypothetical protein